MQFFIFIILSFIIITLVKIYNFNKTTYHIATGYNYFETIYDKGRNGEYQTYKKLKYLEKRECKFLFNIYVPKDNGETTEIDLLVITPKGIVVLESKNYSGWIFGNEKSKNWTQVLPQGEGKSKKEYFYNPIKQNETHIKWLKNIIGEDYPIFSAIVFSERCTLKDVTVYNDKTCVTKRDSINMALDKLLHKTMNNAIAKEEILKIYDTVYPYSQVSNEVKQEHIENINNHFR